ncbi:MAG TPA: primosomal protein N' [Nitrospiria bacterium]
MEQPQTKRSSSPAVGEVAILDRTDRVFHYTIPPEMQTRLLPGMRVLVSFRGEWKTGILVGRIPQAAVSSLKPILKPLDDIPLLSPPMLELARWLSEYYMAGWGAALRAVLPPGVEARIRKRVRLTPAGKKALQSRRTRSGETQSVLEYLLKRSGGFRPETVYRRTVLSRGSKKPPSFARFLTTRINPLVRKGWLEITRELADDRLRISREGNQPPPGPSFSKGAGLTGRFIQKDDERIRDALERRVFFAGFVPGTRPFSWAPDVIERTLGLGRNVILLVPEIGVVRTWERRLKELGLGPVTVLHSDLSEARREACWQDLRRGKGGIVLGTRLAVLSPVNHTGLILAMDEDDPSYKQEEAPRYHARDLAVLRAAREKAVVLLSGASPSIETYSNIQSGKYHALRPADQAGPVGKPGDGEKHDAAPPRIISLAGTSGKGPVTEELLKEISRKLEGKKPVLLILNRKGFGMALFCRDCGFVLRCPRCEVAAKFSGKKQTSSCPYCGWERPSPSVCDQCRGTRLAPLGFGTERAEAFLRERFPGARIGRVEGDVRGPSDTGKEMEKLRTGELDMVIGTQAVFNGPRPAPGTLVALVEADGAFHHPDFRAGEKTFRLISRLLSFSAQSEVVIQSFFPGHESISWAVDRNPEPFYESEIRQRRALGYPPFSRLAVVTVKSLVQKKARDAAQRLVEILAESAHGSGTQVLGPAPSLRPRLFQKYRWQILIKAPDSPRLHRLLPEGLAALRAGRGLPGVWLEVDVDPVRVG